MSDTWSCREYGRHELQGIAALVAHSPVESTFHVKPIVDDPVGNNAWFFAASHEDGRVGAFAAVVGTRANLLGFDDGAVDAMAMAMLKSQTIHTSREAHRHVLLGPATVVDRFWAIFQDVGRQVVGNRKLELMASGGEGKGSRRLTLDLATHSDLPVLTVFAGDYGLERHGFDPRKVAPAALERQLTDAIDAGRLLVARESGRAMFMAIVRDVDEETVLLDRVHVPVAYRGRKILVGGALFAAAASAPVAAKRVLVFIDGDLMQIGAARAGYTSLQSYREVAMLG